MEGEIDLYLFSLFNCDLCRSGFKSVLLMRQHLKWHQRFKSNRFQCESNTPEMYKCKSCDFATDLKVPLSLHYRFIHQRRQLNNVLPKMKCYVCQNCCFMTYSLLVLLKHECHEFNRDLSSIDAKRSEERRFKYDKIVLKVRNQSNLKMHILPKSKLPGNVNWYRCTKCSFKTKSKITLERHEASKHVIHWHECEKCSYKGKQKKRLEQHILSKHTPPEEIKWHKCDECSYKTSKKSVLRKHILFKHTCPSKIDWFECKECTYKAKQNKLLQRHILDKHTSSEEINWHQCDKCPYKAKRKDHLQQHARIHGNCWYQCDQCSHRTKAKFSLKLHILKKHTNKLQRM